VANIYAELGPTIADLQRRTKAERARLTAERSALVKQWNATKANPATAAAQQQTLLAVIHANSTARINYNDMAAQFAAAVNDAKITQDQSVQLTRLHDAGAAVLANPSATSGEKVQATTILDAIAGRRPFGLQLERVTQALPSFGQIEGLIAVVAAIVILPPLLRFLQPRGNA
jgi:hypothetical protein